MVTLSKTVRFYPPTLPMWQWVTKRGCRRLLINFHRTLDYYGAKFQTFQGLLITENIKSMFSAFENRWHGEAISKSWE